MIRILIVDDDIQDRYMMEVLLKGYEYEVVTAANGAEALELALNNPPELIVSDILMPVMDGFAFCRRVKSDELLKHIPVVFYTATYTDPKDEEFALSLGAERFIVKPQSPEALVQMLREIIEEYRAGKSAALCEPAEEEQIFYKHYNEALVRKLEEKVVELEQTRYALEHELAERKRAEEALEQRVKERTAEIESKKLELERMNKMFIGRELNMLKLKDRIRELENTPR